VGDGTRIDERTVVKRSVVGRQCVIGRDVKIINSVLMDHVTVPDRCRHVKCTSPSPKAR